MPYLLSISIGPVQDFIAASRRTADLTAGSTLLVELAKCVAESVQFQGGQLIFPAPGGADNQQIEGDIPNKILAVVPNKPKDIATIACDEARRELRERWSGALNPPTSPRKQATDGELTRIKSEIDLQLAQDQIDNFLELYAAWVPLNDTPTYDNQRKEAERLLAGRKALRDFATPLSREGYRKSPLDTSRDGVIQFGNVTAKGKKKEKICQQSPLFLKSNETLDAVSLLKRISGVKQAQKGGRNARVPSTSDMALRSIQPQLEAMAPEEWRELETICAEAGSSVDMGDLFFYSRTEEAAEELEGDPSTAKTPFPKDRVHTLRRKALSKIGRSECPPYYAILVADGDKMGAILGELATDLPNEEAIKKHQDFSRALTKFAEEAEKIIHQHMGFRVYLGGDDVFCLLPVNRAVACAAELAQLFRKTMETEVGSLPQEGGTLSVGLAIVHSVEPMDEGIAYARAAEKHAKIDRNSLAIALHKRSGEPLIVRESWGNDPAKVAERWQALQDSMTSGLSRGFPYELRELAREWPNTLAEKGLQGEARRILQRKLDKEAKSVSPAIEEIKTQLGGIKSNEALEEYAKKLVIARYLSSVADAEVGRG